MRPRGGFPTTATNSSSYSHEKALPGLTEEGHAAPQPRLNSVAHITQRRWPRLSQHRSNEKPPPRAAGTMVGGYEKRAGGRFASHLLS
jgi:hypothetical protein